MAAVRLLSVGASLMIIGLQVFGGASALAAVGPPNDSFANRITLSGSTLTITASNTGATIELGEPKHAGEIGGRSVWWTWTAPNTGTYEITTEGSTLDTLLGVYLGSSVTNLNEVASNDDFQGESTSSVFFRAITGETYQIAVDGFQAATGTINLKLFPSGTPQTPWTLVAVSNLQPVSVSIFRNKVVLVDFFETTCNDCIIEEPDLLELRRRHLADGFEIVAVSKDNSPWYQIQYRARDMGIDYLLVLNDTHVEATYGGPLPMPTKVLVDREGKIQIKITGGQNLSYYESVVRPLIRGASNLRVDIDRQPGNAVISWPMTEFGYVVEAATSLPAGSWTQVSNAVVELNNQNTVTIPQSEPAAFYRLRKP